LAAFIAIPALGYLGLMVVRTPELIKLLLDIGLELVNTGKQRIEAFNTIAEQLKEKDAAKA